MLLSLALILAPAAAPSGHATEIVVPSWPGFLTETLDGTVTGSVSVPPGADPTFYAAAANGSIVYNDASGQTGDYGPVWLVSPGAAPVEVDSSAADFDASISPDGTRVVFARYDPATTASDIYVANADGSGLALVASGMGDDSLLNPTFSPDGSSIAYYCTAANSGRGASLGCGPTTEGTYWTSGVMLMNADGSDKRMIVEEPTGGLGEGPYSWSPDGKSLVGSSCLSTVVGSIWSCGPTQLFVYGTNGSDLFRAQDPSLQLTRETEYLGLGEPQFTPDGTQVLFTRSGAAGVALYAINSDGSDEQEVSSSPTSFAVVPPASGGGPPAAVNVTEPAGVGVGSIVTRSELPQCRGLIELAPTGAFTRCMPFPKGGDGAVYAAASDGTVVLADDKAGTGGDGGPVWLVKTDGEAVELDSSPYDFDPTISYDGSTVAFARRDPATGASDIYTVDSDGSNLRLVASGDSVDQLSTPEFSPDGSSLAYSCARAPSTPTSTAQCGPLADGTYRSDGIILMNADGSDKRMILANEGGPFAWSPDGQWLAVSDCATTIVDGVAMCGASQIFVFRSDGSDLFDAGDPARQVTQEPGEVGGAFDPKFSSDGTRLVFMKTVDGSGRQGNFAYEVGRDGSDEHELALSPDPPRCTGTVCDYWPTWGELVPPATGGPAPATVRPRTAMVPAVKTLSYYTAKRRLASVDLASRVTGFHYSKSVRRGHVIAQYPAARSRARLTKKHRPVVKLVLSRGRKPKKR